MLTLDCDQKERLMMAEENSIEDIRLGFIKLKLFKIKYVCDSKLNGTNINFPGN